MKTIKIEVDNAVHIVKILRVKHYSFGDSEIYAVYNYYTQTLIYNTDFKSGIKKIILTTISK